LQRQTLYDFNQLYVQQSRTVQQNKNVQQSQSHKQTIEPCDDQSSVFDGLRKLSLFRIKEEQIEQNIEDNTFTSLLSFIDNEVYFRKKSCDDLVYWEVYADKDLLDIWITKNINESNFDFILWPNNYFKSPKLLVFDMDSTFIQIEVIDELARRHGVGDSVSKVTEAAMRGELDFSESLVSRVACLRGLASSTIGDIASNLPLSVGVKKLVEQSKKSDVKTAIVSGGFTPFVQHLKNTMDLFEVKANDLEIVDGRLSGKVLGDIVDAKAKADFVNYLKAQLNIQENEILTIGDGANDLLMMQESGFNLAYRAKPAVQEQANGRMNFTYLNHLIGVFDW